MGDEKQSTIVNVSADFTCVVLHNENTGSEVFPDLQIPCTLADNASWVLLFLRAFNESLQTIGKFSLWFVGWFMLTCN